MKAVLEFLPWTVVPDLGAAVALVEATGRSEVGILVDTLHFDRSGILGHTPGDAVISGTGGLLTIPRRFYRPGPFTLTANGLETRLVFEEERNPYAQLFHQAVHLAESLGSGLAESPVRPLAHSVPTSNVMDEARRQVGVALRGEEREGASGRGPSQSETLGPAV